MRLPRILRAILFYLIQWTWGLPQNLVGLAVLLLLGKQERYHMHGALVTIFEKNRLLNQRGAVSLGRYIFIPDSWDEDYARRTAVHEYGHTVQSMILGPFYLLAVGLPSVIWARIWSGSRQKARLAAKSAALSASGGLQAEAEKAKQVRLSPRAERIAAARYTSRYPENWANLLGEYVTGETPPKD